MAEKVEVFFEGHDRVSPVAKKVGLSLSSIGNIAGGILAAGIFAKLGSEIMSLGRQGIDAIQSYERMSLSLQTLAAREMRNADATLTMEQALKKATGASKELLDWTQKLAIKSPFTQEGVALAFQAQMAYGFTTAEAKRLTQAFIDMASGMGLGEEAMSRISFSMGQMKARGRITGEELREMTKLGIPVLQILAKSFGKTTAEVQKMITAGLVPADKAIEAIVSTLEEDFAGAAERQSLSWAGLLGTFEDLKKMGLRAFFQGIADVIQPLAISFSTWLQEKGIERIRTMGKNLGAAAKIIVGFARSFSSLRNYFSKFMETGDAMNGWIYRLPLGMRKVVPLVAKAMKPLADWWVQNGPAITASAKKLIDGIIDTFKDLAAKILPFINDTLGKFRDWFDRNGPEIASLWDDIVEAFLQILPVVSEIWDIIEPILGGIIDLVLGLAETILEFAEGDWEAAWQALKKTVQKVGKAIQKAVETFIDKVAKGLGSSLKEMRAIWADNWKQFKEIMNKWWKKINEDAEKSSRDLRTGMADSLAETRAVWKDNWEQFKQIAEKIWKIILTTVGNAIMDVLLYLRDVMERIRSAWNTVWEAILTKVSSIWNSIVSYVNTKIQELRNYVTTTLTNLQTIWNTIWGVFVTIVTILWNTLVNTIKGKIGEIGGYINSVIAFFQNLYNKIQDVIDKVIELITRIGEIVWPFSPPGQGTAGGGIIGQSGLLRGATLPSLMPEMASVATTNYHSYYGPVTFVVTAGGTDLGADILRGLK